MRFSLISCAIALATVLTAGLASHGALAAPAGLTTRALDLELKAADVKNVFQLLSEVSERKLTLDPCVQGTVDIRLKNTPLPLVLDALAMKLHLVYEDRGSDILVRCVGDGGEAATLSVRVSANERDAALPDVLGRIATQAKLDGVDYRATARPKINVTLENVRLSTAISVVTDQTGLKLSVGRGKLVVSD